MSKHLVVLAAVLVSALAAVLVPAATYAQDPVFSQPYISPVYLNPAATGAGDYDYQVSVVHRREWLTIPSQFNYTVFSASHYMPSLKSGVGVLATDFSEGYLKTTGIYANYSYSICTSDNDPVPVSTWIFTGAFQVGMAETSIDYSQLVFADQINQNGYIPGSISAADAPIYNKRWYPDFAGGLLISNKPSDDHWLVFGASAYHFNRPDQSLTATSDTFRSQLPVRWNASVAYQVAQAHWSWSMNLLWYHQQQATTWQLGVDIYPSDYPLTVGFWGHFGSNFGNPNAIGLTITYDLTARDSKRQSFKVAATQDFPVGGNGLSYTTGSTQLGMLWQYNSGNTDKGNRCQPMGLCPPVPQ